MVRDLSLHYASARPNAACSLASDAGGSRLTSFARSGRYAAHGEASRQERERA
jgi:hypothetical protein